MDWDPIVEIVLICLVEKDGYERSSMNQQSFDPLREAKIQEVQEELILKLWDRVNFYGFSGEEGLRIANYVVREWKNYHMDQK